MIPPQLMPPPETADMAETIISNAVGIQEYLHACEACGLPVDSHRKQLNDQVEFAANFLRSFFPERLPS